MLIAIPIFQKEIAPCFEVAGHFLIADVEGGEQVGTTSVSCEGDWGFNRARLLRRHAVNVLICNGIKGFYQDLLKALGLIVIKDINLTAKEALKKYLTGELKQSTANSELCRSSRDVHLEDLFCWTKNLFHSHGYRLYKESESAPFPIDLIAEIKCPVCRKPVRVGICCGAHSYSIERELAEFKRASSGDFHAQVYVHPAIPGLEERCLEFGIELLDPLSEIHEQEAGDEKRIPLLKGTVSGHEKASG